MYHIFDGKIDIQFGTLTVFSAWVWLALITFTVLENHHQYLFQKFLLPQMETLYIRNLDIVLPHNPAIPVLVIYSKDVKAGIQTDTDTQTKAV